MGKQSARRPTSGRGAPRAAMASSSAHDEALRSQQRTQRVVLVMGVVVLMAFAVGMVIAFRSMGEDEASPTSTSTTSTERVTASTVVDPNQPGPTAGGPPVSVAPVAPGEQLTGPTPCPALDGTAPRVTSFAEPPPMCIDTTVSYTMTMRTSVGDLQFFLNPDQGAAAVNNFIVLAAYHYYDGLPLTKIDPLVDFQVAPSFTNPSGVSSPGYPVPLDAAPTVVNVGSLALLGTGEPGREAAGFKVAVGQDAVGWSSDSPIIGLLLDGLETLQHIRKAGTPKSGAPTQVITIDGITTTTGPPLKD